MVDIKNKVLSLHIPQITPKQAITIAHTLKYSIAIAYI